jgi:phosphate transport system permease protein
VVFSRRLTDNIFAWLFRAVSFTGAAALGAIVIFIFVQGSQPFIFPGARTLRLVVERIDNITVNGQFYENPEGFIELPWDTKIVLVEFLNRGEEQSLEFRLSPGKKGKTNLLQPIEAGIGAASFPDAYTCSVTYPGIMAGITQKIHLILPEPPYNFFAFLGGMEWLPAYQKKYGIFPMILGSIFVCFGALLLGVPIALLCSLFMSEFMPEKMTNVFRSAVELLAGIPSVVYGFFGLMVIVPFVKQIFNVPSGNSLLSATLVLTIMILPTVIAISEKCLQAVPRSRREASLALGASKMQTALFVVLPHAKSGVLAGIILGFSRAVGETMAVILVAGNSAQLIKNPLEGVRTLTATIALEMGYAEGRHSQMLFAIGIVLLVMILLLNSIILFIRRKGDEEA